MRLGLSNAEAVSKKIGAAFIEHAGWRQSENEQRELRKKATFAIYAENDDLDQVAEQVNTLFTVLGKTNSDT